MGKLHIGTSGYNYPHWGRGVFYPRDVPQRQWLEYYSRYFDTVELNVTFYRLPKREVFEGWYQRTPEGFVFAVKGSRYITHIRRLRECEEPIERFSENLQALREKLQVILWQLPPRFTYQRERLVAFSGLIAASPLLNKIRHAFEFRHESWFVPEAAKVLEEYGFSFCISDSPHLPSAETVTADFVYLRFHGSHSLYSSKYTEQELVHWA
ncbi:MAG: DUF72 domain-containing protein, partial [Deltaproteobacteria bacterium]|nr:DUF72 domain-containing protein [Deltaproteobacteria bacterium]